MFLLHEKGIIPQICVTLNIVVFQLESMLRCLLLNDFVVSLTLRTQTIYQGPKKFVLFIFVGTFKI